MSSDEREDAITPLVVGRELDPHELAAELERTRAATLAFQQSSRELEAALELEIEQVTSELFVKEKHEAALESALATARAETQRASEEALQLQQKLNAALSQVESLTRFTQRLEQREEALTQQLRVADARVEGLEERLEAALESNILLMDELEVAETSAKHWEQTVHDMETAHSSGQRAHLLPTAGGNQGVEEDEEVIARQDSYLEVEPGPSPSPSPEPSDALLSPAAPKRHHRSFSHSPSQSLLVATIRRSSKKVEAGGSDRAAHIQLLQEKVADNLRRRDPSKEQQVEEPPSPPTKPSFLEPPKLPSLYALTWLRSYTQSMLIGDLLAGLTIGLMVVPQSLAYASIAELPHQYGLYSSYIGVFVYLLFGTANVISVGPTAIVSLLVASTASDSAGQTPVEHAVVLSLLAGSIQALLGFFRAGALVEAISFPVVNGFTSAAALLISAHQIRHFLGITRIRRPLYYLIYDLCDNIGDTRLWDPIFGVVCVLLLLALGRAQSLFGKSRRWRFAGWFISTARNAIVIFVMALFCYILNPDGDDSPVLLIGDLPAGLPSPDAAPVTGHLIGKLWHSALAVALIGFLEDIAIAKAFARQAGYRVRPSQELWALGLCNIAGSFFSAFPVTGSFTRTAVNAKSGARTPASGLVCGVVVIIALEALTPAFFFIPKTALAAIITVACASMVDLRTARSLWRQGNQGQFAVLMVAFLGTLFAGVEIGILAAVGVSMLGELYRQARPPLTVKVVTVPVSEHQRNVLAVQPVEDATVVPRRPSIVASYQGLASENFHLQHDMLFLRVEGDIVFSGAGYLFNASLEKAENEHYGTLVNLFERELATPFGDTVVEFGPVAGASASSFTRPASASAPKHSRLDLLDDAGSESDGAPVRDLSIEFDRQASVNQSSASRLSGAKTLPRRFSEMMSSGALVQSSSGDFLDKQAASPVNAVQLRARRVGVDSDRERSGFALLGCVVLEMKQVQHMDLTAMLHLLETYAALRERAVALLLAGLQPQVREFLAQNGFPEHLHEPLPQWFAEAAHTAPSDLDIFASREERATRRAFQFARESTPDLRLPLMYTTASQATAAGAIYCHHRTTMFLAAVREAANHNLSQHAKHPPVLRKMSFHSTRTVAEGDERQAENDEHEEDDEAV